MTLAEVYTFLKRNGLAADGKQPVQPQHIIGGVFSLQDLFLPMKMRSITFHPMALGAA